MYDHHVAYISQMSDFPTPLEERENRKRLLISLAALSTVIGIAIIIWYVFKVSESHSIPTKEHITNLSSFGAFGDFIGGVTGTIFSLTGIFLLYLTLSEQRDSFHRERTESNYFEMIRFHRDNVEEMQFSYYESDDNKVTAQKRKVFKMIFSQFKNAWTELDFVFNNNKEEDIYKEDYRNTIITELKNTDTNINLKNLAKIDLVYLIVYFGLGTDEIISIRDLINKKYKEGFVNELLDVASLKPTRESAYWTNWESILGLSMRVEVSYDIIRKRQNQLHEKPPFYYPGHYSKYYGGHQFRLGHYYRHLYQSITFIDREEYLSDLAKYKYIKILRGQLSNYEQIILSINSISSLGRSWELHKIESTHINNKNLITKYNLIKNIPKRYLVPDLDILMYYPNVKYEANHKSNFISYNMKYK